MQSQQTTFDGEGDSLGYLNWSPVQSGFVQSGASDQAQLVGLKNALLQLRQELFPQGQANNKEDLLRRFQLLEQHVDGLLRRKITFSLKDQKSGTRSLDYTGLLNEKENQIIELERKIANLEQRLQKSTARQAELENQLSSKLGVDRSPDYQRLKEEIAGWERKLNSAASLWTSQLNQLRRRYPNEHFELDAGITAQLVHRNVNLSVIDRVLQVENVVDRVIEVPVQDVRTKSLINRLASDLKRLTAKYPQLRDDMDSRLLEYLQQELLDLVEVDELDRLVQIVKYVPEVVRVENVYSYSSDKNKRIEYHLRVLVKALLIELEKLAKKTGLPLEIQESLLAMINQEIAGVVDVEEVLHAFTVVPKIVEVEKIVEKIVERVVEVPQVVPVERIVEKIVEVVRYQEVEKIVHVPVEVIKIVDREVEKVVEVERIVERMVKVPQVVERIVERVIEVPKIVEVEKVIIQHIPQTEIVEVEKIVTKVVTQIKEVRVEVEKIVPMERIIEKIVEVPYYVDRVIEKVVHVPQIVEVEKIVQKIVKVPELKVVRENGAEFNTVYKEIERIVEKIIVVENTVERILEVPQIIEKVVVVNSTETILKEIEVIREKLVPVVEIREVERIVNQVVPLIKEVEKIVERKVEVPFYQERIVQVPQITTKVVIEHEIVPRIIEVEVIVEKYITKTEIMTIEVPVVKYVNVPKIVHLKEERIVEVPRTVEKIKEVRVNVEKIIEKMVEVPKVVEVERIVEKLVVVPRIIEKIVEVPQLVDRIVERIVEIEKLVEVVRTVEVPVEIEKIVEVEVIKTVVVNQEKLVDRIVEKAVPVERIVEKVLHVNTEVEKIVAVTNEVPKTIEVERIVPKIHEVEKIIEVERSHTVKVEVPVEVERIVQKLVPVERLIEKVVQVPQMIDKIIAVQVQNTIVEEVERIVEKVVQVNNPKAVPTTEIVVQENIKEVQVFVERLVPVKEVVTQIVQVPQIVEKIVEKIVEVIKYIEVEKIVEKIVEVPKIIELRLSVPQLVRVNQVYENTTSKTVAVPVIQEVIKEVNVNVEKIIAVNSQVPEVHQIEVFRDKIVQVQQMKEVSNTNNYITKELQVVDRYEQRELPVYSTIEKIIEVPSMQEKVVERIIMLPQVVEVLKYVHEIAEHGAVLAVLPAEQAALEGRLRELSGKVTSDGEKLLAELRKLRNAQPQLNSAISIIESYLLELGRLTSSQRILTVPAEKIVEKIVGQPVLVPTQDSSSLRNELALSLLVEKLILELKRLKQEQPGLRFNLDQDISLMFFSEVAGYGSVSPSLQGELRRYTDSIGQRLGQLGSNWNSAHELMLNTILQERFVLGALVKSANEEIDRAKNLADRRLEALRRFKLANSNFHDKYVGLERSSQQLLNRLPQDRSIAEARDRVRGQLQDINQLWSRDAELYTYAEEPTRVAGDRPNNNEHISILESKLREATASVELWRSRFVEAEKKGSSKITTTSSGYSDDQQRTINNLRSENERLNQEVRRLQSVQPQQQDNSRLYGLEQELKQARADSERARNTYESQLYGLKQQLQTYEKKITDFEVAIKESERATRETSERQRFQSTVQPNNNTSGLNSSSYSFNTSNYSGRPSENTRNSINGLLENKSITPSARFGSNVAFENQGTTVANTGRVLGSVNNDSGRYGVTATSNLSSSSNSSGVFQFKTNSTSKPLTSNSVLSTKKI